MAGKKTALNNNNDWVERSVNWQCVQSAMDEELELTTDGSDIFVSRKVAPYVICAISLTSAAVKTDGDYYVLIYLGFPRLMEFMDFFLNFQGPRKSWKMSGP